MRGPRVLRPGEGKARRKRGLGRVKKREKGDIGWECRGRRLSQRGFLQTHSTPN